MDNSITEHTSHTDKMRAIERYLSQGWALVPLHHIRTRGRCSCGESGDPAVHRSAGKHPIAREWQTQVRRDVMAWQGIAFACNIGIATGRPSGFWVLDYDPASAGLEAQSVVDLLIARDGLLPHVETGGTGKHWRFTMPVDFEVTNRRGSLPAGLDVRGTGGQVVAPPSVSGKGAYVELTDAAPYMAPGWLLDMIRPAGPAPTKAGPPAGWLGQGHLADLSGAADHGDRGPRYAMAARDDMLHELRHTHNNRNDLAWRAACRIIEFANAGWLDLDHSWRWWHAAALDHPDGIVVPESEVRSIWQSAQRHVGSRVAEIHTPDPLAATVLGPPLPPWEPPPFPVSGNGAGASNSGIERPTLVGPISIPEPMASTGTDPRWEAAVQAEMSRVLARDEAKRRLAKLAAVGPDALRGELLDTAAMLARPRLVPIVEGLLYQGTVARINGQPGCGKTFVTLDLAARVVAGMSWCDRATTTVPVVYVVAEGGGGVGRRIEAWQTHHGRPVRVTWLPRGVQIGGPEWDAWCDIWAERSVGLIVFDTQARATVGRDEIDGQDMGEVLAALDALATRIDGCVLLVHHTPVGGNRARGHGALTGGLQTELLVSKNGREITVKTTKGKDDDDAGEPWVFDLTDVMPVEVGGRPVLANAAPVGVVPVWRGDRAMVDTDRPTEPEHKVRARALWNAVHTRYGRSDGGTRAEIRQAFADSDVVKLAPNSSGFRNAWLRAWADLLQLGLIAKAHGAARYKVVCLADQSADGVLTSNIVDGAVVQEAPPGWEVIMEEDTESK